MKRIIHGTGSSQKEVDVVPIPRDADCDYINLILHNRHFLMKGTRIDEEHEETCGNQGLIEDVGVFEIHGGLSMKILVPRLYYKQFIRA